MSLIQSFFLWSTAICWCTWYW